MIAKNKLSISYHLIVLISGMLLCGIGAIAMGKDLGWDLANYHYSNGYLFLHHHMGQDFWPASYLHVHFAPTGDILSYLMITHFSPILAVFISGAIHGIDLWLIFRIALLFLEKHDFAIGIALIMALIGMFGAIGSLEIGNFTNDHLTSLFVLIFIFYQFKSLMHYQNHLPWILWLTGGGIALGIAMGLKLTAGIYVAGTGIAYWFLNIPWRDRLKMSFVLGIAFLVGLILSSGYWMLTLWHQYHNPVFPFLNNIFHSADYAAINWHFTQYKPQGFWKNMVYPAYFSLFGSMSDGSFRDLRYLFLYLLLIITGLVALWKKCHSEHPKLDLVTTWLCFFYIFTYVACLYYFGIIRYMLVLEMLAPLSIYILLTHLVHTAETRYKLIIVIFFIIVVGVLPLNSTTRIKQYYQTYFSVAIPGSVNKIPEAMVLFPYSAYTLYAEPRPISYLTAFLPRQWHFVGIPFTHDLYDFSDLNDFKKMHQFIDHFTGPLYLMASQKNIHQLQQMAVVLHLTPSGICSTLSNDERSYAVMEMIMLCPVVKDLTWGQTQRNFSNAIISAT